MSRFKHPKALRYNSLWKTGKTDVKVASGQYDAYYKKSLDAFCLKVDMAESIAEYAELFCDGMIDLLDLNIPKSFFMKHQLLITKILRFGEDLIEYSRKKSDLFYIGLFVDHKISSEWLNASFYRLILKMLHVINKLGKNLPQALTFKIENMIKEHNYPLYALYFIKDSFPAFKASS